MTRRQQSTTLLTQIYSTDMETETEYYADLFDWVQRGSGRMGWGNFCYTTTLDQVGLPSAKRYFTILYKFNDNKPLSEEYLLEHKEKIINELFKDKLFVSWLQGFISSQRTSDSWVASATIRKNRSIAVKFTKKY